MSRVGNSAITIPSGCDSVTSKAAWLLSKVKNGELSAPLHNDVELVGCRQYGNC